MFLVARLIYVEITRGHGHARKTAAALSHMLPRFIPSWREEFSRSFASSPFTAGPI